MGLSEYIGRSLAPQRMAGTVAGILGALGLVIAAAGPAVNVVIAGALMPVLWILGEPFTFTAPLLRPDAQATLSIGEAARWLLGANVSLVLFKCPTWDQARTMLAIAFGLRAPGAEAISSWWFVLLLVCLGVHWLSYKGQERRSLAGLPDWLYAFGYGAAWALVLPWAAQGYTPFIYFQF